MFAGRLRSRRDPGGIRRGRGGRPQGPQVRTTHLVWCLVGCTFGWSSLRRCFAPASGSDMIKMRDTPRPCLSSNDVASFPNMVSNKRMSQIRQCTTVSFALNSHVPPSGDHFVPTNRFPKSHIKWRATRASRNVGYFLMLLLRTGSTDMA